MKKIIAAVAVCAAVTGALMAVPKMYLDSVPTAKSVSVRKVEHTDTLEISGSIIKNAKTGGMSVIAFVSEKDISAVHEGVSAEITGDAFPDCVYTGEVVSVAESAGVQQKGGVSRTVVEVEINIQNPDMKLKPGFTATAVLKTSDAEVLTIVPYEAVKQDGGGEYVYILQDNSPCKRYILTGRELPDGVEIVGGIAASDRIITISDESAEGKTVFVED